MLKPGMTLIEKLNDRAAILQENGYEYEPIEEAIALIQSLHDDVVYLNKLCITMMSLLPESVTTDDIKAAMKLHGAEVREEKRIITDV